MLIITKYPDNLMLLDVDGLVTALINWYSRINPYVSKWQRYTGKIFNAAKSKKFFIEGIISAQEFNDAKEKVRTIVEKYRYKPNNEILHNYCIKHLGSKCKNGAFESLQGWKKSYSIYCRCIYGDVCR